MGTGTDFREDTPTDKPPTVHPFGSVGGTTKDETPASAQTDRGRDQLDKGVDVTNDSEPRSESRAMIALDYLRRATADLETATRQRRYYMAAARAHGVTFREIGDACGITDAAARFAIKRHAGTSGGDAA